MPIPKHLTICLAWKREFLCLAFYWVSVLASGDGILPSHPLLDRRNSSNGLAYNEVTCFFQDKKGFTWIGTEFGLSRFDGRKFKNYRHEKGNPNSLPHSRIVSICQLADERIAIGTEQGFCFLSPDVEKFESFLPNDSIQKNGLEGAYYSRIFQDSKRRIWVYCLDGLYLFDPIKKQVKPYRNPVEHPKGKTRPGNQIYAMIEDRNGTFWVGTGDGLFRFLPDTNQWERAFDPSIGPVYLKFGLLVGDLALHPNGTLFFTTFDMGLHRLDVAGKRAIRVDSALPGSQVTFGNWKGKPVCWYRAGNGLKVAHADSLVFRQVQNPGPESDQKSSVSAVYSDPQHRLWLGFSGKGLGWLDAEKQVNRLFTNPSNVHSFSTISTLLDEDDRIWVGNYHGNDVSLWDKKTGKKLRHWLSLPGASEPHTSVGHILSLPNKNYWFSTLHGLFHYAENEEQWAYFQPNLSDPLERFRNRQFVKALPAGSAGLWLQTYALQLCYFDLKTNDFHFLTKEAERKWRLGLERMEDMATDANGTLWIIGDGQILSRKPGENQFTTHFNQPGLALRNLAFAPNGDLWISTSEGFLHRKAGSASFQKVPFGDHFPVENLESVTIDAQNRLWTTHLKGITVFDPARNKSRQFTLSNGLPREHLSGTMPGSGHRLWYFSDQLVGWINTETLDFEWKPLPVHLTSITHQGKPLHWLMESGEARLSLAHHQNDLEVGFSIINYYNPLENRYFYKVEGGDSAWTEVSDGKISFSNLAPGSYRLLLSATENPTAQTQSGLVLIVVEPPFWETWWFRLGAILFLGLGIYFYLNQRIRKIKEEAEAKAVIEKEMAELQMRALRTQMNPHFLFNSFNAIQECVIMGKTQEAVLYLAKFAKLVRLILEHSDKSLIPLNQEIEVLKNYLEVEGLRFSERLETDIQIHTHLDTSLLQIPPMLVQPFVENAIWHGLSKKEGLKRLIIRFESTEEHLMVTIEDNGIGRQKAAQNQTHKSHRSMALSIIEDRFRLLDNQDSCELSVEDLVNENGQPLGTRVTLKFGLFN